MRFRGTLSRQRRIVAVVLALLLAGGLTWLLVPGETPVRTFEQRIEVVDGPADDQRVSLDTALHVPETGGPHPAVLLGHGFGSSKEAMRPQALRLAAEGYAVLTWSARGFGRSTGEIALNSPDYEVKDTKQLVDWLARRPEVRLDAPGDPRVGMAGGSYGGAIALLTAAHDTRIDAIVPQITWYDLADSLFPNAAGTGAAEGVFKKAWAGLFFGAGGADVRSAALARTAEGGAARGEGPAIPQGTVQCGRFLPAICEIYQKVAESGRPTPEAVELLRRSSPSSVQGRVKVPTLLLQGLNDSLFPIDQADANAKAIAATGAPVEVAWFDGGHDGGDGEADRLHELTRGWFDRWLARESVETGPAFAVTRPGGRDPGTRRLVLQITGADRYPGISGTATRELSLTGERQEIANPAGGSPASISSVPGFGSLLGGFAGASTALDMPGQSAVFETAPLTESLQLTGASTIRLRVTPGATVFVKLYDVSPGQPGTLPRGLAAPVRVPASGEVSVRLPAVDHRFGVGHRLRLTVTSTDMGYATPVAPAVYQVALGSPTLTVPVVDELGGAASGPPWWTWAMPLGAVVVAAVLLLTGRRAGTPAPADDVAVPAREEVPLVITGLTKRYRNGELAVDDLSFRVERGQVLGLLGPNGAGKTTTLRMLMGLIVPDAGQIQIYGQKVKPGASVLSRLGSFVEGPGFLPHLSGRANLKLYWQATGRPADEAHMDEALEIADLGAALERPVRTYSQGMRQRLAIAQAMLGLPDLLVLDEPTNGLDPPQIREMRRVLIDYAATGRTVIVSSHLLAEVELTCTHVVVMRRGRLIAAGEVKELIASERHLEDAFLTLIGDEA
ncbi:alpha/beta fold hydrolase [Rhizohabitans arisaemae]|uniref:alpha/beta fold hydrolase n=1 Tax=Rhizohabitans arisaemae TaxID=2720610 RepID=UPI0024B139C6|nr:alpha/beta fold hydrolase [Rhizohabitans arisaemae]